MSIDNSTLSLTYKTNPVRRIKIKKYKPIKPIKIKKNILYLEVLDSN